MRRTDAPFSPSTTSPTLCAAAQAENHRGSCADSATVITAAAAIAMTASVLCRRPLDVIDDHNIGRHPLRNQTKSKLLTKRSEQRRPILAVATRNSCVRCPTKREVEAALERGLVLHGPAKLI